MAFTPYATYSEADLYVSSGYGLSRWLDIETRAEKTQLLTEATRLMDMYVTWKGTLTDSTQENKWPRTGVYDDGVLLSSDTIPTRIKYACVEIAYNLYTNKGFSTETSPVSIKVGSLHIVNDMKRIEESVFTKKVRAMIDLYGSVQIASARTFSQVSLIRT